MKQADYGLENSLPGIVSPKTRALFKEPLECYLNGAYRLAIVGLWTVVVFDLLEKVTEMASLYSDPAAESLLKDVELERKRAEDAKSPRWEVWLLEEVGKRTQLLEAADLIHLRHIHELRNLCAHPILKNHSPELQNVNIETARACFVQALDGLLLKPALLTRKIVDRVLVDLSAKDWDLTTDEEFEKFFSFRYLDQLSGEATRHLFRSLWKLTFRDESPTAEENRPQLRKLLQLVFVRDSKGFLSDISSDPSLYGNLSLTETIGEELHHFLTKNFGIYSELPKPAKLDLDSFLTSSSQKLRLTSFYRFDSLLEFLKAHATHFRNGEYGREQLNSLPRFARGSKEFTQLASIAVEAWRTSPNYVTSGKLCPLLNWLLPEISDSQLMELMAASNENDQVHDCVLASDTCFDLVREAYKRMPEQVTCENFPNLRYEIQQVT